ncbi:hypothetical protein ABIA20_005148 [Sinorhizobium fredii]
MASCRWQTTGRQMSDESSPLGSIEEILRLLLQMRRGHAQFANLGQRLSTFLAQIANAVEHARQSMAETINVLGEVVELEAAMQSAGWLWHYTTPLEVVRASANDPSDLKHGIDAYYREKWPDIAARLDGSVGGYDIEPATKAAFAEALRAHENGLYRSAVRLLFPEIENEVRINFFENSTKPGIAGQKELLEAVGKLPIGHVLRHPLDYRLFTKLVDHVYAQVHDANRSQIASDPVPNRHAALHGLVEYSTAQNSINALIMAEYSLRLIATLKNLTKERGVENGGQTVNCQSIAARQN